MLQPCKDGVGSKDATMRKEAKETTQKRNDHDKKKTYRALFSKSKKSPEKKCQN